MQPYLGPLHGLMPSAGLWHKQAAAKLVEKRERQRVTAEQEEAIISAHADVVRHHPYLRWENIGLQCV